MREEEPFRGSHDEERGKLIQIYDSMDVQQSKCGSVCRVRILSLFSFLILYFHSSSEKKWKFHGAWPEAERGKEQKLQGMGFISFQSRVSSLFIALWMVKWPEQTKDLQFRDYSFPRGGMLMKWTTVLSMKWIAWGPLPMQWSTQKRSIITWVDFIVNIRI